MTSIPRSSNPHLLQSETKPVSRKEIYSNEGHEERDPSLGYTVEELNEAVKRSLLPIEWDAINQDDEPQRKRRKVEECLGLNVNMEDSIPFRLVSSVLPPIAISLLPKPPPPPVTREPECEDDEVHAELRRKQAEATAVDFDWIIYESQKPVAAWPSGHDRELFVTGKFQKPSPGLLLLESLQPRRCTRPPVPVTELNRHPYAETMKDNMSETRKISACMTVNVEFVTARGTRKRRRRGKRRGTQ